MSESGDSSDEWVYGESREWLEGRHKNDNRSAYRHAGEIGHSKLRRLYTKYRAMYARLHRSGKLSPEMPARFYDTEIAREIRRIDGTETLSRAIHDGDAGVARSMVGATDAAADISGMQAIEDLKDIIGKDAFLEYLFGTPGSGKTSFACLQAQLWKQAHPDGLIGSNIRTLEEKDDYLRTYGQLDSWLKQDEEDAIEGDPIPKLFIFDEANTHASGRGADGYETASKLGPLTYKIRKYGGSLIIIGHDGKDIHPAVRELAIAVEKEDFKHATFYETIANRKGRGEIMSISGIPDTDYTYNDMDPAGWSWADNESEESEIEQRAMEIAEQHSEEQVREERMRIAREMRGDGKSLRDIAEYLDVSHVTVSNWLED